MVVVIEFFAKWPNARKPFSPRSLMLSEDKSNVVFLKADVEEAEDVTEEFDIYGTPNFLV